MTAGRKYNNDNKEWNTPDKYVLLVRKFFGGSIDLDSCSNDYSIVKADNEYKLPIDGLLESWNFHTIYVNPPYGRDKNRKTSIKKWIAKCYEANKQYKSEVLSLIPVATNTRHWKDYIFYRANSICFLYDTRLKFLINGENVGVGAPMACCMVYWGNNYDDFVALFQGYGAVVRINNGYGMAENTKWADS